MRLRAEDVLRFAPERLRKSIACRVMFWRKLSARRLCLPVGADGVGVEIVEGNGGGPVMGGLRGGVDDDVGADGSDQVQHALAVPDVEFVVGVGRNGLGQPGLVPARVALGGRKRQPAGCCQRRGSGILVGRKRD